MRFILVFIMCMSLFSYDKIDPPEFTGDHYDEIVTEEDGITYGMLETGLWYAEYSKQQADVIDQYEKQTKKLIFLNKAAVVIIGILGVTVIVDNLNDKRD